MKAVLLAFSTCFTDIDIRREEKRREEKRREEERREEKRREEKVSHVGLNYLISFDLAQDLARSNTRMCWLLVWVIFKHHHRRYWHSILNHLFLLFFIYFCDKRSMQERHLDIKFLIFTNPVR